MTLRLILGDCVERMRELEACSIDAIVCDPPYSIEFMGRTWDRHEDEDAAFGYYLAGLIDGEGHFRVQAQPRGTYSCAFAMKMRADDRAILEQARRFLGVGSICDEPRRDGSAPQAKLVVQAKLDCLRVVEVLTRYPLRAKKLRDFLHWADAVVEWNEMKRGNRWTGPGDWARLEALKASVESARAYRAPPWSGNGFQDWTREWAEEALRVLKPGGHLLAFGGSRTYHRLAAGVEDAGFEVRDQIVWMYGSGFPKSLDAAKAIDKQLGREGTFDGVRPGHEDFVERTDAFAAGGRSDGWSRPWRDDPDARERHHQAYVPATGEAERWQGWGTALKPAMEPIVVARKPLVGTVAANLLEHGVGAINVDGCRVGTTKSVPASPSQTDSDLTYGAYGVGEGRLGSGFDAGIGRWPANVVLAHTDDCVLVGSRDVASDGHFPSARPVGVFGRVGQDDLEERHTRGELVEAWECAEDCPVRLLDEQAPDTGGGGFPGEKGGIGNGDVYGAPGSGKGLRDTGRVDPNGGASRFFYTAKTSRAERNAGLDEERNGHPTVKPVELMRWLVRLVTPPGGTLLDPFLGSGTTGIAAVLEGFDFVGVERDPEYLAIAEARIRFWSFHGEQALDVVRRRDEADRRRAAVADSGQLDLLGDPA